MPEPLEIDCIELDTYKGLAEILIKNYDGVALLTRTEATRLRDWLTNYLEENDDE